MSSVGKACGTENVKTVKKHRGLKKLRCFAGAGDRIIYVSLIDLRVFMR